MLLENKEIDLKWVDKEVKKIKNKVIADRRYLHMHPETGFDTVNTENMIKNQLKDLGIGLIPSSVGVMGIIHGSDSSKVIALRADMDALFLQEENEVPYKSQNPNKMHACGHDGHTAMLLSAASILQNNKKELPYDILLVFQPAEEGPDLGGARIMLKDIIEQDLNKKIIAMFGLHLFNDFPTGKVGYKYGSLMSSTDEFDIKIIGQGGHAGQPHKTIDALSIGCKFVSEMESYMSRRIDPLDSAVFSVGAFSAGTAKNIVADSATIAGTIRCQSESTREKILLDMEKILKGICSGWGCSYKLDIIHGLPVLYNKEEITTVAKNILEKTLGKENIETIPNPSMGAEDFAYFAEALPATFLWVGSANEEKGFTACAHHPKFDFDEDALLIGVKTWCILATMIKEI